MATLSYEQFLRPVSRALVYNPGERFERNVAGETYHFPSKAEKYSDLLREIRPDGRGGIRHVSPEETAYLDSLPPGVRPVTDTQTSEHCEDPNHMRPVNLPSAEILNVLLGDSGRDGQVGTWGVRILFGDNRDRAVIAEAEATYRKKLYAVSLAATTAHKKQNQKLSEAGMPPAPPTPELMKHYKVVAEADRGGFAGKPCDVCFWPASDDTQLAAHKREFHAIESKPASDIPPPPDVEEETVGQVQARQGRAKRAIQAAQ